MSAEKALRLPGPILVLGGSGFIGANLFRALARHREDAVCTAARLPAWRLEGVPQDRILAANLLVETDVDRLLERVKPRTIFHCVAYGGYHFQTDSDLIYRTNFNFTARLLERLEGLPVSSFIHAGSSSEYGDNSAGPNERDFPMPNSGYAVSKLGAAHLLYYFGKKKGLPCANLRLYSVYGPLEDASRLIPTLVRRGVEGGYPPFVDPEVTRDFVYVDDACEAFVDAALALRPGDYGESFNIGTGRRMTIREAAEAAREVLEIPSPPAFGGMENRRWDRRDWYASIDKASERFGWKPRVAFPEGLRLTADWYRGLADKERYHASSKQFELDTKSSVSAIVACYKDGQAVPIMHERLKATFERLKVDYEIIFVNDNSPDDSEDAIRRVSSENPRVVGISHSRNFGSQACFRSGMEIATKNACVLLDGDLQDPPEVIEEFVAKWREGYEVVYGRRSKREASLFMRLAAKAFYWVFNRFSYIPIPRDAGDFSLLDRQVVRWVLQFPERDLFLRGVRAYVGFRQIGVEYFRPARRFGTTTNSFLSNVNWAKRGIFSFSNTPLNILTVFGVSLFGFSVLLALLQLSLRLLFPELSPKGITTVLLVQLFFGSLNILGVAILGEYISKIIEEVKGRPHFIRRSIIKDGVVKAAAALR
ncbi:MAG: NAD-dependent epimerase/dehydratase family protein [Elusimicrobia bacterium]|nr:NAD-dependent epimerase/dehydratase family protein [Elusimicrobiota bacterium]